MVNYVDEHKFKKKFEVKFLKKIDTRKNLKHKEKSDVKFILKIVLCFYIDN